MHISRVQTRLLLGYIVSHLLLVSILGFAVSTMISRSFYQQMRDRMHTLAQAIGQHIATLPLTSHDPSLIEHLEKLGQETGFRLTLIRGDGTVAVDSQKGTTDIGPHGHRSEITEARRVGIGYAQRYSSTLKIPTIYLAMRIPPGPQAANEDAFIRVANPSTSLSQAIGGFQRRWWTLLISLSLLGLLSMLLHTSWTLQPFHEFLQAVQRMAIGTIDPLPNLIGRRDEWGALADSFRYLQTTLSKRESSASDYSKKMETVLASMKEGIIAIDENYRVLLSNPAAETILNLEGTKLVERSLFDVVRSPELSSAIDQTRLRQSTAQVEFKSSHHPRRTISAKATPLLGRGHSPTATSGNTFAGAVLVLSDITEMRHLESVRQDFVANVSHELKTPLASIKAYAETLRLGALFDSENNMEFVVQIEAQADLLHRQIEDLLQLARVESGEQNWNIQSVKLNQACKAAVKQFRSQANSRGVELAVRFDLRNPKIEADADAIRIVLNNLVSNAIRYTRRDGTVTLETTQEENYAVVRVIDTGIGIAPEHHARIFERFYRVDRARSRDLGGTGLGLAIVKHFVQGFGGRVELDSQVNEGSTFSVWLPLQQNNSDEPTA